MEGQSSCGPTISTSNRAVRRCARSPRFTLPRRGRLGGSGCTASPGSLTVPTKGSLDWVHAEGLSGRAGRHQDVDPVIALRRPHEGTVTLIEICSGAVDCGAMAMDQRWGVGISGGSVERGNLTPDREALIYFGSPLGRAEPMPSWSKVRGDAAKGRQEPLGMPHRFKAFHRPFALSGGLMRVLGAIVEIPRLHALRPRRSIGPMVPAPPDELIPSISSIRDFGAHIREPIFL